MSHKKSVIKNNFILSLVFGVIMGLIFPLYASIFASFSSLWKLIVFTAGCIVAGVIVGFTSFFITKKTILVVVQDVGKQLDNFNNGETDYTSKIKLESEDELGFLVNCFNKTISDFKNIIKVYQKSTNESQSISVMLSEDMNKTVTAISDIDNALEILENTTNRENSDFNSLNEEFTKLNRATLISMTDIIELYAYMEDLTSQLLGQEKFIDKLLENINHISESTGGANNEVGDSLIFLSNSLMIITKESLLTNSAIYNDLKNKILQIDDIASNTEVLSINASIEAARSGREGEGFKVIASEIRELSTRTRIVTNEIKESIDSGSLAINSSAIKIEASQEVFLKKIDNLITKISELNKDTEKIKSGTDQVSKGYYSINSVLIKIKKSLLSLKDISEKTIKLFNSLDLLTDSIKHEVVRINNKSKSINKFTSETDNQVRNLVKSVNSIAKALEQYKVD